MWRPAQHNKLKQRNNRNVECGDKSRLAAGDGLKSRCLQCIAKEDGYADCCACYQFAPGDMAQGGAKQDSGEHARHKKAEADKKQRAAISHRDMDDEKGRSPQYCNPDKHHLGAGKGEKQGLALGGIVQHNAQIAMSNIVRNSNRDVLAHVGENLLRLRRGAGLSQQLLAERSGISRRMIVSVESGDANISLSSLDRLAEALGVSFVDMVSDSTANTERIDAVAWRGAHQQSQAMLLASAPARREAQLWSWSLGPDEGYQAAADPSGWHEMIFVLEGELRIELENEILIVAVGDYAVFDSAQTYAYINNADCVTRFIRNTVV